MKAQYKRVIDLLSCMEGRRGQILSLLNKHGPLTGVDIEFKFSREYDTYISQSQCSNTLKILHNHGLVSFEVDGKYHIYSINHEKIERIRGFVSKLARLSKRKKL